MIVSQLVGGLGNQLFQYAAGRALALRHRTEFRLDTSPLAAYPSGSYALDRFGIAGSLLSREERARFGIRVAPKRRVARMLARVFAAKRIPRIRERRFEFDPAVLDAPATCYLEGYWQSPKYFAAAQTQIRAEFEVRDPLEGTNLELAQEIGAGLSVSLHVRRGDYVTQAETNRYHGTCSPQYYAAAEKMLRDRYGDLRLFVFSDEPDWVAANLQFASPARIVRHNGPRAHEDLRLMSLCRHHIVANSTFSWWGAWLCPHADKVVIAPQNWFGQATHSSADLIPENWLRI